MAQHSSARTPIAAKIRVLFFGVTSSVISVEIVYCTKVLEQIEHLQEENTQRIRLLNVERCVGGNGQYNVCASDMHQQQQYFDT